MNNSTILVVDDEAIIAKNLQRTLSKLGYRVPQVAFSGEDAVTKAHEIRPDLILMDISMPGDLDGIDAANIIRPQLDVPIIFVTAHADNEIIERAKISEPFGYILKPVTIRELQSNIEMALYKHQIERELKATLANLQATQNQLVERERLAAVGQLAGGIAHEFNNIMAAVILQSDLLLTNTTLAGDVSQKIKSIRECGERAAGLIQQILDFSRKAMLQTEPVEIVEFLNDLQVLFRHLLGEKITLELAIKSESLMVRADASRLKQALVNLVLNSQNAMPGGGILRIEASQRVFSQNDSMPVAEMERGRWVCLRLEDNGTGIAPDVLPHVFEPFFTTDSPYKSGLGLSQTLGIIQQHQGHLIIESTEGRGTAVTIYLPFQEIPLPDSEQDLLSESGTSGRILLFETNEPLRYALSDGLVTLGYDVLVASHVEEAQAFMEQFGKQILCLICDEQNEGATASSFGKRVMITYPHVNVILLADYVSLDDDVDELGIVWLRKPVSLDLLENAISRIMQHRSSTVRRK